MGSQEDTRESTPRLTVAIFNLGTACVLDEDNFRIRYYRVHRTSTCTSLLEGRIIYVAGAGGSLTAPSTLGTLACGWHVLHDARLARGAGNFTPLVTYA